MLSAWPVYRPLMAIAMPLVKEAAMVVVTAAVMEAVVIVVVTEGVQAVDMARQGRLQEVRVSLFRVRHHRTANRRRSFGPHGGIKDESIHFTNRSRVAFTKNVQVDAFVALERGLARYLLTVP